MPTLGVFAQITNLSHQDILIGKLLKFYSILLRILRLEYVLGDLVQKSISNMYL